MGGTPILYGTLTPSAPTTFKAGGVISGTFTSTAALSADGIYTLALYDGTAWEYDPTPGVVSGDKLTFSYTLPSAQLVEPVTYDIAITKTN